MLPLCAKPLSPIATAGWEMPLAYPGGTLAEHRACRRDAVAFDVSHLGSVRIAGPGVFDRLQDALSNDLRRVGPGRAQYTHLLAVDDASVVDDIIVWWVSEDEFQVMPNASNTERVIDAIGGEDMTATRAVIAVQGPGARSRLRRLLPGAATVPRFGVSRFEWDGLPGLVAGTGYTGEDGVECSIPAEGAESLWSAILGAGVQPAGLGARDTLRLEAALPLHGHELGRGITPLQAGLGWVIGWDKERFRGREALMAEKERGPSRHVIGLIAAARQPFREGSSVIKDGVSVGTVTSGNFSPMLEHGIALALVATSAGCEPATSVAVEQRGRSLAATVTKTPFVRPGQWAVQPPVP
ncbi:MAG: glycine cleavage system aminomethyltransferase GcvT [Acidimicrobiales bacterium]